MKKVNKPITFKQIARENIKIHDKELHKELAKKMINSYYFTDENLKVGSKINLVSHDNNRASSILSNIPISSDLGIETRYLNKVSKEVAPFYARLTNQPKNKYHSSFSASFYKINEEDQRRDEIEIFIYLNINQNLTESDSINIDIKSQLYDNDSDTEYELIEYDDYDVLSEDSDTGENIGFRNM